MIQMILVVFLVSSLVINKNTILYQNKKSELFQQKQLSFTGSHLLDLISSNLGVIDNIPKSKESQHLIRHLSQNNIFHPILLNYVFILESSIKIEENDEVQIQLDICKSSESCFFDSAFNSDDKNSLVNQIENQYKDKLAYLFTNNQELIEKYKKSVIYFEHESSGLKLRQANSKWSHPLKKSLLECIQGSIGPEYIFFPDGIQHENNFIKIPNFQIYQNWIKDLCGSLEIAKLIKEEGRQPNIFVFHLESFDPLEKLISKDEFQIIQEIWQLTLKKFKNIVENEFKPQEITGQVIITSPFQKPGSEISFKEKYIKLDNQNNLSTKNKHKLKPSNFENFENLKNNSLLDEQTQVKQDKPELEKKQSINYLKQKPKDENYFIKVGCSVLLSFILLLSVESLIFMQTKRDSLIYSKILHYDPK